MQQLVVITLLSVLILSACRTEKQKVELPVESNSTETQNPECATDQLHLPVDVPTKSQIALRLDSLGLVDISELDSTIVVSLIYATPHNFVGEVLYDGLTEAYLHPEAAEAVVNAQRFLKETHPDYTLIVYDATRPMSVQRKMWDLVKGTSKYMYVSNPSQGGGLHNYGLAVDISILDTTTGEPLPMGTEVDHFGYEAHTTNESGLVEKGIITRQEKENRQLLRRVAQRAGLRTLPSEWWHFNLYSREVAKKKYPLVE